MNESGHGSCSCMHSFLLHQILQADLRAMLRRRMPWHQQPTMQQRVRIARSLCAETGAVLHQRFQGHPVNKMGGWAHGPHTHTAEASWNASGLRPGLPQTGPSDVGIGTTDFDDLLLGSLDEVVTAHENFFKSVARENSKLNKADVLKSLGQVIKGVFKGGRRQGGCGASGALGLLWCFLQRKCGSWVPDCLFGVTQHRSLISNPTNKQQKAHTHKPHNNKHHTQTVFGMRLQMASCTYNFPKPSNSNTKLPKAHDTQIPKSKKS